jgi:DnaJ-class molecular chaperone
MVETDYYQALGLDHSANREQISNAFHRLALRLHPLCNDQQKVSHYVFEFSKVCEAFDVLSSVKTRHIYDTYGTAGLRNGIAEGPDSCEPYVFTGTPYKVFERYFGTTNPFVCEWHPEDRQPDLLQSIDAENRKADIVITVVCTLFEFYCGALKKVEYQKMKAQALVDNAVVVNKTLTIEVKPGYGEQTTLRFPEHGHESFGAKPSDLIIKFKLNQDATQFSRHGDDLVYVHTCTLLEALELKPFQLQTLDSRILALSPTETLTPQTELRIAGEGMPRFETGDIVVDTKT